MSTDYFLITCNSDQSMFILFVINVLSQEGILINQNGLDYSYSQCKTMMINCSQCNNFKGVTID